MDAKLEAVVLEEVTDPVQLAEAQARRVRFDRNWTWFEAHAAEIYTHHRGKCICIAGEELFVADTAEEVLALASAAHPEDEGRFTRYIPRERTPRIYVAPHMVRAAHAAQRSKWQKLRAAYSAALRARLGKKARSDVR